jgi:hypothetical protein
VHDWCTILFILCLSVVSSCRTCGGVGLVLHGVWQVRESAKALSLIVDSPGQHVSPRVQYGMA